MSRARLLIGVGLGAFGLLLAIGLAERLGDARIAFTLAGAPYELLAPAALALLAFLPLLLWASLGAITDFVPAQRALSLAVRSLLACVVVLALARPATEHDATRISVVVLADVSDSMDAATLQQASELIAGLRQARGDGDLQVVTFAERPRVAPADAKTLARHVPAGAERDGGTETNLQAALQLAYGLFPPSHLRRVLFLSDGRETRGTLLAEAARAQRLGVRVHHRLLEGAPRPEVAVLGIELPTEITVGETFELTARVFASTNAKARLRLYQDQVLNGLDGIRDVELAPGETELRFRSIVRTPGRTDYRLELAPTGPDHFAQNNRVTVSATVPGKPSVLLVDRDATKLQALARALLTADFEVDLRNAPALPQTLAELGRHDFVILSDVPAERVSSDQMLLITRYVRDVGGGFMMVGGDQSFGLGGYQGTSLAEILPVTMDSERRRDEHSLALALVIDCSGSMNGQKIELAKEAARVTAELLGASDSLEVVGFSGEPERVVRMQSASNRVRISQSLARITAQGGTAIFPALDLAFQDLLATTARVKHVILLTDGQTQEQGIPELVSAMRAEGITVSTVGLGTDVNRSLLQQAANVGTGRAYFTSDPNHVPRIFVRETTTVGKNSAVEELVRMLPVTPADFLEGLPLETAPLLRGYVATGARPAPAQVILESELGEPLLARWRVGLGWALAWTSDLKGRWATDLLRWPAFPKLVGQLVRAHARASRHDVLPMTAVVSGDELRIVVDAVGHDDRFLNALESSLTIEGPATGTEQQSQRIALRQSAPGRYEARTPLRGYGAFTLEAAHEQAGRVVARSHAVVSRPYPAEYAAQPPNAALLERMSSLTSGRRVSDARELFDAGGESIRARSERWSELVWLALGLYFVDLLLRRVRLFERAPR